VAKPVAFGVAIVLVVFLPILALQGVEGKLFQPMALTMIFALLGSLVVSLTLMPVLVSLMLTREVKETEPWLARAAHRLYAPVLTAALRYRKLMLAGAVACSSERCSCDAHWRRVPPQAGRGGHRRHHGSRGRSLG